MSRKGQKEGRRKLDADLLIELCDHVAMGGSLRAWAEKEQHDPGYVVRWLQSDEERLKQYRAARQLQADTHIDQLIELADSPVPVDDMGRTDSAAVNQLRLRVDTRKWIASKYHPGMYGDRMAVDANVNTNLNALPPDQIMGRIVDLLAKHGLKVVPASSESSDGSDEPR